MNTPDFVRLSDLQKLLDERDDRTESRVVAAFQTQIAELSSQVQELVELLRVSQEKSARRKKAHNSTPSRDAAKTLISAWRDPHPDYSSDEEESSSTQAEPSLDKHGVIAVMERIKYLGLGSKVLSSPKSKTFWDPTGRTISVTTHTDGKGQALFEQSSKGLMPSYILTKEPKWHEAKSTASSSSSSTQSTPSQYPSSPSSPPTLSTPSSSPISSPTPNSPLAYLQKLSCAQDVSRISTVTPPVTETSTFVKTSSPSSLQKSVYTMPPPQTLFPATKLASNRFPSSFSVAHAIATGSIAPQVLTSDECQNEAITNSTAETRSPKDNTCNQDVALNTIMDGITATGLTVADARTAALNRRGGTDVEMTSISNDHTASQPHTSLLDQPTTTDALPNLAPSETGQQVGHSVSDIASLPTIGRDTDMSDAPNRPKHAVYQDQYGGIHRFVKKNHEYQVTSGLGKRKVEGERRTEPTNTPAASPVPIIFEFSGTAFQDQLFKDIRRVVRQAEKLTASQPWFEAFLVSTKGIRHWASDLAKCIQSNMFHAYQDGQNTKFRNVYSKFTQLTSRCVPTAWELRDWLQDFVLPYLFRIFCDKVHSVPLENAVDGGPSDSQRRVGLSMIFEALLGAYLRMVLLKAQSSMGKVELCSHGGPLCLHDEDLISLKSIEDMAVRSEYRQAQLSRQAVRSGTSLSVEYERLVNHVVCEYGTGHKSLERLIAKHGQESGKLFFDLHLRWSSIEEYLKDAEDQRKLVPDDGVETLTFRLRVIRFQELGHFDALQPSTNLNTHVSNRARKFFLRGMYTRLHQADDLFCAIHGVSIIPDSMNTTQTISSIAKDIEQSVVKKVAEHAVRPVRADEAYKLEAELVRQNLIDNPIEALKSAVTLSLGNIHVPVIMNEENSGVLSSRNHPKRIEVLVAPLKSEEEFKEPRSKWFCWDDLRRDNVFAVNPAPKFRFNDDEKCDGPILFKYAEGEYARDKYEEDPDYDSDDEQDNCMVLS